MGGNWDECRGWGYFGYTLGTCYLLCDENAQEQQQKSKLSIG